MTSTDHRAYDETLELSVSAEEAYAYLSDVANLPDYLPPIHEAAMEGTDQVVLQGTSPTGDQFEQRGRFQADPGARRLEWAAAADDAYSGYLTVAESGPSASTVTVHVEFGPNSVGAAMDQGEGDPMTGAVQATLETIRRKVEGEGGEIPLPEPPPEAAEASEQVAQQRQDITTTSGS